MGIPALKPEVVDLFKASLKACQLFQDATEEALAFAESHVERIEFKKDECIILEYEANDFVFFIEKGCIEISSYLTDEKRVQRLVLLKAGSNFAEFSILTKSSRSGSAFAVEDSTLLRMDGPSFLALLTRFPSVSQKLLKNLTTLNSRIESLNDLVPFFRPDQLTIPPEVLNFIPVGMWKKFGIIPVSIRFNILTIISKEAFNQAFYDYLKKTFPQFEIALLLIGPLEFDSALETAEHSLKNTSRSTTRAIPKPSSVIDPVAELRNSPLLSGLPDSIFQQIVPHLKITQVPAGATLTKPGAPLEFCIFLAKGKIQLYRQIQQIRGLAPSLLLTEGDFFGEVNILAASPNVFTAKAIEDCTIIGIPAAIIIQLTKVPHFCLSLARALAVRLQALGHVTGLTYFKNEGPLNFKEIGNILPTSLINSEKVMPLRLVDNELFLGTVTPDTNSVMSSVSRYLLKYRVKLFGITEDQFNTYNAQLKSHVDSLETVAVGAVTKLDVSHWLDHILLIGLNNRASDIHFEPTSENFIVRYRIDGVLREHNDKVSLEFGKEIVSRVKIISHMDISQQHLPQDGQLKSKIGENLFIARASTIPIRYGEKVVLRIIRSQGSVVPLTMVAPDRRVISLLKSVTKCRQGLFLVTGPTGSGKTTTLYSMLNAINDVGTNVITLEDPVEMEIAGLNQIEVDRKRGLDFALALRAVLRQDPNVLMVGEIRDEESAKIVFHAAITGHLVFSTLHTNSSLDVAPRLLELGVSPATLSAGLLGVLSQRLLRANCKKCITSRPTTDTEKEIIRQILKIDIPPAETVHSKGCISCNGTGYHGRLPVFEVWRSNLQMRRALNEKKDLEEMMKIVKDDGFDTLLEFGLKMVLNGLTTIEEVHRVLASAI
jgi:type II secretory ATPase GspE/PulE/Tfp pilus assembly ATPase PilB-like protein